jgi:gliding motility-associated-like protein
LKNDSLTRFLIVIGVIIMLHPAELLAQKEGLFWYFGGNAGLRFHQGYPEALSDGALSTVEGCSSISSDNGKLRLYTDGITVYNRKHQVMDNGDDLMGSPDATQSGVIVPVPDDTTLYYIFTVSSLGVGQPHDGFRYSLVDMKLGGGYGAVAPGKKNVLLAPLTTERVTSVHHKNDYGVWVIMHEWESSRFRAYLITTDSTSMADPVISDVGSYHGQSEDHNRDGIGYMKVSPDGRKLAVAILGKNIVEVFDFNDTTGYLSNPIVLPVDTMPYGVEFSAGAEFLYCSEREGDKIYQWNMLAGSPQDIIDSRMVVGELDNPFGGAMQMASDGRIYIARKSKFYLSMIKYPYLAGMDCEFHEFGVDLMGGQSKEGLPTFIQSYFNSLWIIPENECIDQEIFFSINSIINIDSIHWNFDDPASGANQAWGDSVSHWFSAPGKYSITATCYHLVTETVVTKEIDVLPLPDVELGSDLTLCRGDTATFYAGDFLTYTWNDNPSMAFPFYYAAEEGQITIAVTNTCGIDFDTVNVYVQELPEVELGPDTSMMYETVIELDAGIHTGYLWQDSSTQANYVVDSPGTFWVDVYDEFGCASADTIRVSPIPFKIHVPSAFTPNNDNLNDHFEVFTTYEVDIEYELMIFDRWGEQVFETRSIDEFWDGNFRGQPCPVATYTWVINASTYMDDLFFRGPTKFSGTVTLLR